jgi:23S rRNA (cytosine1962-C5)-methyltransferase
MTDSPGAELPQLLLKRHEDKRIRGGHAWVFSNEVDTAASPLTMAPGAAVAVLDHRRQFVGHALVNPHALICARIMSRDVAAPIGPELFATRLASALALRERYCGGQHYRLVYGESDGLPGLVVDRFGDVLDLHAGDVAAARPARTGAARAAAATLHRVEERYRRARSRRVAA